MINITLTKPIVLFLEETVKFNVTNNNTKTRRINKLKYGMAKYINVG